MATKSTAVSKAKTTAVALVNYVDEVAALAKRLQASTGDRINVSNAKLFEFPDKSVYDEIDCIVVDFVARNMFYSSPYSEDQIVPPYCFAIGLEPTGLCPSDNSPDKQCASCAGCWANQFKSAQNGKGKACSNTRLLAIVPLPPGGLGANDDLNDLQMFTINVSPTAITSFDTHVSKVASTFRKPIRTVVTRISFAQDSKFASLRFAVVAPAGKDLEVFAQSKLAEAQQRLLQEPDVAAMQAANDATPAKGPAKRAAGGQRRGR